MREARRRFAKADRRPGAPERIMLARPIRGGRRRSRPGRSACCARPSRADELSDLPAETAAWYHVMVGHTLIDRAGSTRGRVACRMALAIFPRDYGR